MPDPIPDPITTSDLYGATPPAPAPLPVEETPEIPMEPSEGMPPPNKIREANFSGALISSRKSAAAAWAGFIACGIPSSGAKWPSKF